MMFRKSILFIATLCAALALPVPLLAKVTSYMYQPHYMTSVEEASNQVQFLSPRLIPLRIGPKTVSLSAGYSLERLNENKLGLNLFFTKSGVEQKTQYFWAWDGGYNAPVSTPYKSDVVISIAYAEIESFEIWDYPWTKGNQETWCVVPVVAKNANNGIRGPKNKGGGPNSSISERKNNVICATSEADAQTFADALATLTVAGGKTLSSASSVDAARLQQQVVNLSRRNAVTPASTSTTAPAAPLTGVHFGFQVRPVIQDDMAPLALTNTQGLVVVSVENGSLADTVGILAGDVILQVNGAAVGDFDSFVQTIQSGAVKRFRIWRKGQAQELIVPRSL
jgi:hypothetical protein